MQSTNEGFPVERSLSVSPDLWHFCTAKGVKDLQDFKIMAMNKKRKGDVLKQASANQRTINKWVEIEDVKAWGQTTLWLLC